MYLGSSNDKKKRPPFIIALFILVGILPGFLISNLLLGSIRVGEEGMSPSIKRGDILFYFKFKHPKKGDIVLVKNPAQDAAILIRRVKAVGGDRIALKDKNYVINGSTDSGHIATSDSRIFPQTFSYRDNMPEININDKSYFVTGDNFDQSYDSRHFGPVLQRQITGVVFLKF